MREYMVRWEPKCFERVQLNFDKMIPTAERRACFSVPGARDCVALFNGFLSLRKVVPRERLHGRLDLENVLPFTAYDELRETVQFYEGSEQK